MTILEGNTVPPRELSRANGYDAEPVTHPDDLRAEIGQTTQIGVLRVNVAQRFDLVIALVH